MGVTSSTLNFVSSGPRWSEIADFEPIMFNMCVQMDPSKKSYSYIHTEPETNTSSANKQIGKSTKAVYIDECSCLITVLLK